MRPGKRRALALWLLTALLFMQGALAAEGCFVLQALPVSTSAVHSGEAEPDCHGAVPASPQPCFSYCLQADQALAGGFDHQNLAPPPLIAMRPAPPVVHRVCAGPLFLPDPGSGPPHRILHCSFLN